MDQILPLESLEVKGKVFICQEKNYLFPLLPTDPFLPGRILHFFFDEIKH